MPLAVTFVGSLLIHRAVLLFLQSLHAGTVILFLIAARAMAGVRSRCATPVRAAIATKSRRYPTPSRIRSLRCPGSSSGVGRSLQPANAGVVRPAIVCAQFRMQLSEVRVEADQGAAE